MMHQNGTHPVRRSASPPESSLDGLLLDRASRGACESFYTRLMPLHRPAEASEFSLGLCRAKLLVASDPI